MIKVSLKFSAIVLSIALLGLVAIFSSVASAQRPGHSFDPLAGLKRALEDASATALSADQETQLKALIEARRSNHPTGPGSDFETARAAYDAAILAGDQAKANAQAAIIAGLSTAATKTRLETEAKFKLDVLAILKTGGQLDALTQKLGSDGLLRLLGSLAGGPGGFGGPRGPGGPGRPGGPNGAGIPRRP